MDDQMPFAICVIMIWTWGRLLSFSGWNNTSFEENSNNPLEYTPGPPRYNYERNSCINMWLRVSGMFQGFVGVFLESFHLLDDLMYICTYNII